jgi:hypothetical protein
MASQAPAAPSRLLRDQGELMREVQAVICDEEAIEQSA